MPRSRPAPPATSRQTLPALSQIGVSGVQRYGGRVYDEWLPELVGPRGRRTLREMSDNDPVIGALLFGIEMLVRQVDWTVQPGSDDAAGKDAATFVDECLHTMEMTWEDTLAEILSMLVYGWSYHELVYQPRPDGRIGWANWAIRGQETLDRWEFDPNGRVLGLWQLGPPDYVFHFIPAPKALLFRTTSRRMNPEGRSVLRNAYQSWFFKKHIQIIEGIGIERDLAGLPVAWVPAEMLASTATAEDQAQVAEFQQIVTNIKRDEQEGIVMPLMYDEHGNKLYDLTLLSSGGSRQFDTDKIIARYDQRIAMTVLADFILLGHEAVGTQALGATKSKLFTSALDAWLKSISAVINDKAIPRLLRLNGLPADNPPHLHHGDVADADLASMGQYLTALTGAGVPLDLRPDGPLVKHLMTSAGLPEPADDLDLDALVEQQSKLAQAKAPPQPAIEGQARSALSTKGVAQKGQTPARNNKGR